jgi:DNA-directed RNA polymerase beta subunit
MQEDAWAVISAFFEAKGLVRQQLDSFNEFINSNMQVCNAQLAHSAATVSCTARIPLLKQTLMIL